jgi:type I restriction enzyme S subunit
MSFPHYDSYKDSGVEWLGEVPGHWVDLPLKAVASHNDDVLDERTKDDYEILYVDISSVNLVAGISSKEAMPFFAAPSRARRRVKHGDVIVSTVRTYLRAIARICEPEDNLIVSTGFAVVRPSDRIFHEFLGYLLSSSFFVDAVISHSVGVSYPAINASDLVAIKVPLPPISEQHTIADFLDRETAKIDALIAEQQRLIELLKEKRQAVISHAVTKGLSTFAPSPQPLSREGRGANGHFDGHDAHLPSPCGGGAGGEGVPMKDSGIEWLGDVPAHWQIKRLKQICEVFPSNVDKKVYENQPSVLLCNYTDVYYNEQITLHLDFMAATASAEQIEKFTLREGDTIITKDSETADDIAIAAYVPRDLPGVICGYHLSMVRPHETTCGVFVKRLFDSIYVKSCCAVSANGLTRVGLGQYALDNLEIPFPPKAEQQTIAAFLDRETAKLDALTAEANRAINLLQERRTALISAAVTGKIDVRGLT